MFENEQIVEFEIPARCSQAVRHYLTILRSKENKRQLVHKAVLIHFGFLYRYSSIYFTYTINVSTTDTKKNVQ